MHPCLGFADYEHSILGDRHTCIAASAALISEELAPATINRRVTAIRYSWRHWRKRFRRTN